MITLLGTAHVFDLRRRVQEEIHQRSPGVVALELDPLRYQALQQPNRRKGGPLAYRHLARFQERLAESYGVEAGDEMLAASDAARAIGIPVALIDRDARVVLRRAWGEMPYLERARLAGSLVVALLLPAKNVEKELERITGDYSSVFAELEEKFPTLKRVLIDERDEHMVQALVGLHERHGDVVAVVGDGHVDGMVRRLEGADVEVESVRLKALQEPSDEATSTASFTVDYRT